MLDAVAGLAKGSLGHDPRHYPVEFVELLETQTRFSAKTRTAVIAESL